MPSCTAGEALVAVLRKRQTVRVCKKRQLKLKSGVAHSLWEITWESGR